VTRKLLNEAFLTIERNTTRTFSAPVDLMTASDCPAKMNYLIQAQIH